jgi:hypothetical protein
MIDCSDPLVFNNGNYTDTQAKETCNVCLTPGAVVGLSVSPVSLQYRRMLSCALLVSCPDGLDIACILVGAFGHHCCMSFIY